MFICYRKPCKAVVSKYHEVKVMKLCGKKATQCGNFYCLSPELYSTDILTQCTTMAVVVDWVTVSNSSTPSTQLNFTSM